MAFDEDLAAAVARFLDLAQGVGRLVEADATLAKPIAELDRLFWKRVEAILDMRIRENPERLAFSKEDRLVVDCGLLSESLLRDEGPKLQTDLVKELYAEGEPRLCYLSEWISDRLKNHIALEGLREIPAAKQAAAVLESTAIGRLREARSKLYQAMGPFFENLPGFSVQAVTLLSSGQLDQTLSRFRGRLTAEQSSQQERLLGLRTQILERARSRCTAPRQLEMFDLLGTVDTHMSDEERQMAPFEVVVTETTPAADASSRRSEFLASEIKIVRSNIKLGVAGAGITRTHSVMLSAERRASKEELAALVHHIEEVDPRLPGRPNILIAPFTGSGFFEWDRDTVYVPLASTRSAEESIVNGIANYRIMIDNLHGGGRLKKQYKSRFYVEDFRGQFLKDYRNWVLGIGRGFRGAMSPEAYEFFRQGIGPNVDHLFAPAELIRLTPNEIKDLRKSLRAKMNRNEATCDDHLKMAYVYHREGLPDDALAQLTIAVRMNPVDGRSMFAMGWMSKRLGKTDKAKQAFKECFSIAPNTIWHIYSSDELGKMT